MLDLNPWQIEIKLVYNIHMGKRLLIGFGIAIAIIVLGIGLQYLAPPQSPKADITSQNPTPAPTIPDQPVKIEDLTVGTGKEAKSGDTVTVQYKGMLKDGTVFDSSYDRGQPFTTKIGVGQVIKGWDEGIPGMKVGGKRRLTIPYSKAYGDAGMPPKIPPKSDLIFEVELLNVK